jgi:hypothetical protein
MGHRPYREIRDSAPPEHNGDMAAMPDGTGPFSGSERVRDPALPVPEDTGPGHVQRSRWQLDDAIESSDLRALTRHVLHAILRRADVRTGRIPSQHQPSLKFLEKRTGLRHETLLRELNRAEAAGWLIRQRPNRASAQGGPGRGHRTHYTIVIPEKGPDPGPIAKGSGTRTASRPEKGPVSPGKGSGTRTTGRSEADLSLSPHAQLVSDRLPEAAPEEREMIVKRLESRAQVSFPAYLRRIGDADLKAMLEEIRAELQPHQGAARPPWCGTCTEDTRLRDLPDGRVTRCPDCHPLEAGSHRQDQGDLP